MPKKPDKRARLQSAMEYLMTYGWAILVIAIVLGVLYYFGVFGGVSLGSSCIAGGGYLCSNPLLNSSGYLSLSVAVTGTAITITGINCTMNTTQPAVYQSIYPTQLQTGNVGTINVKCLGASGPIGRKYSGYVWINYSTATTNSLYAKVAIVSTYVSAVTALPAPSLQPACYGPGTNSITVTSSLTLGVQYEKTVSYTMYGGGGGGSWGGPGGSNGNTVSGNFITNYGQAVTIYAGGGGGTGGYYSGGGGGSGWYGGGGGGAGYEGSGGGGGSTAIVTGGTAIQYASGGAGASNYGTGGSGGINSGGAGGASGGNGGGGNGGLGSGGLAGNGAAGGGTGGTGGNGASGLGGGGGGGYGGGGGGGGGGGCGDNGGSNGGNGVSGCGGSGGTGGDSGTGGGSSNGGNGGSVTMSWAGANCPI